MNVKSVKKFLPLIQKEFFARREYKAAYSFLKEHPQPKLTKEEKKDIDRFWGGI